MSSAMLYNYIKLNWPTADIAWKVHQGKQHGIIIDYIPEDTDLAIFPDAGTNNIKEHQLLKEGGVDVLVIDHHQCEEESEYATIINNQIGDYPNKFLSGGGVVYKFLQVMDSILEIKNSEKFIDMAAVSIVGDMMDLRDYENRYIVRKGLNNIKNIGLVQLVEQQSFSICGKSCSIDEISEITPTNVAWYVVPLVNALVRVGTEREKELLFQAFVEGEKIIPSTKRGDKGNFETVAQQAIRNCVNARSRQNRLKDKAIEELDFKIKKNELFKNQVIFVNVEDNEAFDNTLTGLIAMNFLAKYKKPTIVARLSSDGFWKGSARSSNTTELKDFKSFLKDSELFEFVEGHKCAFGLSLPDKNVDRFMNYANEQLKEIEFNENVYEVDFIFGQKEDLSNMIMELGELKALWGQGIEEPIVVVENLKMFPEDVSFIGANKDTVKFSINGVSFIKFKNNELANEIKKHKSGFSITVVGKVSINDYNGYTTPQLIIDDYEIRDTSNDF